MSPLNTPLLNYRIYYMNKAEKLSTFVIGFLAGGAAGLVFYGGLFRDEDGLTTNMTTFSNIVVFLIVGLIGWKFFSSVRKKQLREKRLKELTQQFRSFLDSLAVSLASGMNMRDSLMTTYADLKVEFSEKAYMTKEVQEMVAGLQNNIPIEDMMNSLAQRSQIIDIKNFSAVFEISYRTGGNLKDVVRRTNDIIGEKIEIEEEIKTSIASNKTQFSVMMVIPVIIILLLRFMSSDFAAGFATAAGVAAMTVAVVIFIIAYILGQKISDVKG